MTGKLFIYPTDTVWGIGGDARDFNIYEKISKIKASSLNKPISLLFSSLKEVDQFFELSDRIIDTIEELYKKEITFGIHKRYLREELPVVPFENTDFICFRIIKDEMISSLIEEVDGPVLSTSLNISGSDPITNEQDAHDFWQKHCKEASFVSGLSESNLSGESSTIVILNETTYNILREGRFISDIKEALESLASEK